MGYLLLLGALLAGVAKGFCGKKVSGYTEGYGDAAFVNVLRMGFCIIIGALTMLSQSAIPFQNLDPQTLWISALSGVTTAAFVVFWLISVKTGAYMMLDVFLMLGVGITVVGCRLFLQEAIRWNQILGFVLLLVAAVIMSSYNISLKGKMSAKSVLLLLACGAANGLTDFSQKYFKSTVQDGNVAEFSFYTYIFAALTLLLAWIFFAAKDRHAGTAHKPLPLSVYALVGLMSVFLFLNSYLKTEAAAYLASAVLYPLNQGAGLLLSMLMAAIFFKEKITPKCLLGLAIAFAALLIINLL
ncbi:MAG: DMT family transporter [Clostridia bacterium]|nr:DMT family transporter [Clostridia bacterium]